jgi:hypothetical protein
MGQVQFNITHLEEENYGIRLLVQISWNFFIKTLECILGAFPPAYNGRKVKIITDLQRVPRLRIRGATPPFVHMPSWRHA